jgi:hypothetical protein
MDLKGFVHNNIGAAKVGLTVEAWEVGGESAVSTTITDADGMWEFAGLDASKTYRIKLIDGLKVLWLDGRTKTQFSSFEVPLSGCPSGLKAAMINFIIDGGGGTITPGLKGHLVIPFRCDIKEWTLLADQSGSIKVDIWKKEYASFPPSDTDSICGGHEPEIVSGIKAQNTDLSDWTTVELNAGDVLAFNVDSCNSITLATLCLKVEKT